MCPPSRIERLPETCSHICLSLSLCMCMSISLCVHYLSLSPSFFVSPFLCLLSKSSSSGYSLGSRVRSVLEGVKVTAAQYEHDFGYIVVGQSRKKAIKVVNRSISSNTAGGCVSFKANKRVSPFSSSFLSLVLYFCKEHERSLKVFDTFAFCS